MKKWVCVTGCSSGIGAATVTRLVQAGFHVIATARQQKDIEKLQSIAHKTLLLDLDDPTSIQSAAQDVKAVCQQDCLFALINNAAYAQPGAVADLSMACIQKQFQTNVFGTIEFTRHCLPLLAEAHESRLCFISSILGVVPSPYLSAYCASKYALEAFISCLRMELPRKIRVVSIRPGPIETRFRQRALSALQEGVDCNQSSYETVYKQKSRFQSNPQSQPTRWPADHVAKTIEHILTKRTPLKCAYPLTMPARVIHVLRHLLPISAIEWIMRRFS